MIRSPPKLSIYFCWWHLWKKIPRKEHCLMPNKTLLVTQVWKIKWIPFHCKRHSKKFPQYIWSGHCCWCFFLFFFLFFLFSNLIFNLGTLSLWTFLGHPQVQKFTKKENTETLEHIFGVRYENQPPPRPGDLWMFRFMIAFAWYFMMDEAPSWERSHDKGPKMRS